jgi:ketosteroid isomerase-like protein
MRSLFFLTIILATCAVPLRAQQHDAALIREARARSNDAIAAHDVDEILAELDSAFQVTAGSGRFLQGRIAMGEAFSAQFAEFPDAVYVRSAESVEISDARLLGFETGTWVGTWTTPAGPLRTGGRYSASWSRASGSWKIRSELFVTLFCEGAGCSSVGSG